MIQVSASTANPVAPKVRSAPKSASDSPGFAATLGAAMHPGAPEDPAAAEGNVARQKIAGTGKDLPEGDAKADSDTDEDTGDAADAAFAWFALPQASAQANTPLGIQLPRPVNQPANAIILPDNGQPALRLPGAALAETGFGAQPASATTNTGGFALPAGMEPVTPQPLTGEASTLAMARFAAQLQAQPATPAQTAQSPDAALKIELPTGKPEATPAVQPLAMVQPIQQQVQAAAQPLTVAFAAIETDAQPQPRRTARDLTVDALTATSATATGTTPTHAVQATADAQQGALDMNRHEWMASMIDRIDALRDSSGSKETSIRLSPDALGTVDVSIRQDGDRVHVHIQAETPAARQLLADAHPRLAELAEAKGIRLGSTSFDAAGSGQQSAGQNGQRSETARAPIPAAPLSARTDTETTGDERVA